MMIALDDRLFYEWLNVVIILHYAAILFLQFSMVGYNRSRNLAKCRNLS